MTMATNTITLIQRMTATEARRLTDDINNHAELLREKLLRFYEAEGWKVLNYENFKAWAIAECRFDWRHVYRLIGVARVEEDLTIIEGERVEVPVNVGKHLAKLPTVPLQHEAYQLALTKAKTIGRDEPTEKHAVEAVNVVEKREFVRQSPHKVVAQMVANDELSARDGSRITQWLNKVPAATQLYVQEKMAAGLTNMQILHKLTNRHREVVRSGIPSRNLTEIDITGRIAGVPLAKATEKDWDRMAAENQRQIIEEEKLRKQAAAKAAGIEPEPIIEPKAMNAYTNSPEKTLHELSSVLDKKTLDGLFELMAQERGYVSSVIDLAITDDYIDLASLGISLNALQGKNDDTVELLMRVKR
jgi:hypothetical protein